MVQGFRDLGAGSDCEVRVRLASGWRQVRVRFGSGWRRKESYGQRTEGRELAEVWHVGEGGGHAR